MAVVARLRHRAGFGVHSPWAFRLIRDVIGEELPYYAYDDLQREHPIGDKRTLRFCRLYLRLSNFMQAAEAVDYASPTPAYGLYISAGCRKTRLLSADGTQKGAAEAASAVATATLTRLSAAGPYATVAASWTSSAPAGAMLIVENIDSSRDARRLWRQLIDDPTCTLTFDLYYCGIVYRDPKRHKQHFIVNF